MADDHFPPTANPEQFIGEIIEKPNVFHGVPLVAEACERLGLPQLAQRLRIPQIPHGMNELTTSQQLDVLVEAIRSYVPEPIGYHTRGDILPYTPGQTLVQVATGHDRIIESYELPNPAAATTILDYFDVTIKGAVDYISSTGDVRMVFLSSLVTLPDGTVRNTIIALINMNVPGTGRREWRIVDSANPRDIYEGMMAQVINQAVVLEKPQDRGMMLAMLLKSHTDQGAERWKVSNRYHSLARRMHI